MKVEVIDREEYDRRTKYWIFTSSDYCPVCNRTRNYRQRYLVSEVPKPKDWHLRNKEFEVYDGCAY